MPTAFHSLVYIIILYLLNVHIYFCKVDASHLGFINNFSFFVLLLKLKTYHVSDIHVDRFKYFCSDESVVKAVAWWLAHLSFYREGRDVSPNITIWEMQLCPWN